MTISLGEFLEGGGYSDYFVVALRGADRVVCLVGRSGVALQYPARYLFAFLENHGMLSFAGSPAWRTVVGGSRTYVDRVVKAPERCRHFDAGHRGSHCGTDGVEVRTADDEAILFEHVVVATHADTALRPSCQPEPRVSDPSSGRSDTRATTPGCTRTPRSSPSAARAQASLELSLAYVRRSDRSCLRFIRHEPSARSSF